MAQEIPIGELPGDLGEKDPRRMAHPQGNLPHAGGHEVKLDGTVKGQDRDDVREQNREHDRENSRGHEDPSRDYSSHDPSADASAYGQDAPRGQDRSEIGGHGTSHLGTGTTNYANSDNDRRTSNYDTARQLGREGEGSDSLGVAGRDNSAMFGSANADRGSDSYNRNIGSNDQYGSSGYGSSGYDNSRETGRYEGGSTGGMTSGLGSSGLGSSGQSSGLGSSGYGSTGTSGMGSHGTGLSTLEPGTGLSGSSTGTGQDMHNHHDPNRPVGFMDSVKNMVGLGGASGTEGSSTGSSHLGAHGPHVTRTAEMLDPATSGNSSYGSGLGGSGLGSSTESGLGSTTGAGYGSSTGSGLGNTTGSGYDTTGSTGSGYGNTTGSTGTGYGNTTGTSDRTY